jgi:serine/threonine protein kinase
MLREALPGFSGITKIGRGSFSEVYWDIHDLTGRPVVLKLISVDEEQKDSIVDAETEIEIHRELDHPFVRQYFGRIDTIPGKIGLVMEDFEGSTLLEELNKNGMFTEFQAQKLFCQLISAVDYLHRHRKLIHGDLKLENVLLGPGEIIKLIDFGFARRVDGANAKFCASLPYAAPEVFTSGDITEKIDIWSLGVILYLMMVGEFPFGSGNLCRIRDRVLNTEPDYPSYFSHELSDLMCNVFEKDPARRIDIIGLKNHPWTRFNRCSLVMNQNLLLSDKIRTFSGDLDQDVLKELSSKGVDTSKIRPEMCVTGYSPELKSYKILKRDVQKQKIEKKFKSILLGARSMMPVEVKDWWKPKIMSAPSSKSRKFEKCCSEPPSARIQKNGKKSLSKCGRCAAQTKVERRISLVDDDV